MDNVGKYMLYICNRCINPIFNNIHTGEKTLEILKTGKINMPLKIYSDLHPDYDLVRHLRGSAITIDGLIGSGKTSLGVKLQEYISKIGIPVQFFEEEIDESFLELFLQDKKKYAFSFQMHMLANRQKVYMSAVNFARYHNGVSIVDRSLIGDAAFCSLHHDYGNISDNEWEVYQNIVNKTQLLCPSNVLYLEVDTNVALERIKSRNRGSETSVYTAKYLEDLDINYKTLFEECGDIPIKYIDWNTPRNLVRDDLLEICTLLDPRG